MDDPAVGTLSDMLAFPWGLRSPPLSARMEWLPRRWLGVELEAGALAPMLRDRFGFEPGVRVHPVPELAFSAGAGLVARWVAPSSESPQAISSVRQAARTTPIRNPRFMAKDSRSGSLVKRFESPVKQSVVNPRAARSSAPH